MKIMKRGPAHKVTIDDVTINIGYSQGKDGGWYWQAPGNDYKDWFGPYETWVIALTAAARCCIGEVAGWTGLKLDAKRHREFFSSQKRF